MSPHRTILEQRHENLAVMTSAAYFGVCAFLLAVPTSHCLCVVCFGGVVGGFGMEDVLGGLSVSRGVERCGVWNVDT